MTPKRVNKTKDEVARDMKIIASAKEKIELVRRIYPFIKDNKSMYDAQTALYALAGYIKFQLQQKEREYSIEDLALDLSKEQDGEIKDTMMKLMEEFKGEKGFSTAAILSEVGDSLQKYGAVKYMENPMSIIKETDFVA